MKLCDHVRSRNPLQPYTKHVIGWPKRAIFPSRRIAQLRPPAEHLARDALSVVQAAVEP